MADSLPSSSSHSRKMLVKEKNLTERKRSVDNRERQSNHREYKEPFSRLSLRRRESRDAKEGKNRIREMREKGEERRDSSIWERKESKNEEAFSVVIKEFTKYKNELILW